MMWANLNSAALETEEEMGTAGKCRKMGLQIGDTIEGREGDDKGTWWDITRLTLLWLGDEIVVWRQTHINHMSDEWSEPKEEVNWSLDYRDWRKVSSNDEAAHLRAQIYLAVMAERNACIGICARYRGADGDAIASEIEAQLPPNLNWAS